MMLFLVGLELQPDKLWELRKPIFGLGSLQVVLTALVIGVAALLLGLAWQGALVAGLALAMSSTAIVLQSLNERGLLKTSAGRSSFAVLLFQDISIIPMLALLPLLAALPAPTEESAALRGAAGVGRTRSSCSPSWPRSCSPAASDAAAVPLGRGHGNPRDLRRVCAADRRRHHVAHGRGRPVGRARHVPRRRRARGQRVSPRARDGPRAVQRAAARRVLHRRRRRHRLRAARAHAGGAARDRRRLHGAEARRAVAARRRVPHARADASRFSFSLAQGGEFAFVLVAFALGLAAHRRRGGRAARRGRRDLDGARAAADARRRQAAAAAARAAQPTSARPTRSTSATPRSSSRATAGSA